MEEYEEQADKFLKETGTEFKAEFSHYGKHFHNDKESRDIYNITLKRGEREFKFKFGQSINNSCWKVKLPKGERILLKADGTPCNGLIQAKYIAKEIFGSIRNLKLLEPNIPTAYDVLACLTKYDIGTFENFCSEFGYNTDSRTAETTYKAVLNEYNNVKMLYSDEEIEKLQEIN